ncbi:hypothetical protein ACVWY5_005805 [Bradyrhizobium sp. USDA 3256]
MTVCLSIYRLPMMEQLANAPRILDSATEVKIGLGAGEIIDGDGHRRLRRRRALAREPENTCQDIPEVHCFTPLPTAVVIFSKSGNIHLFSKNSFFGA